MCGVLCMCVYVHMCVHALYEGQKLTSDVFVNSFHTVLLRQSLSLILEPNYSARVAGLRGSGVLLCLSSQFWDYRCTLLYLVVYITQYARYLKF